jgi:hypothetical protein
LPTAILGPVTFQPASFIVIRFTFEVLEVTTSLMQDLNMLISWEKQRQLIDSLLIMYLINSIGEMSAKHLAQILYIQELLAFLEQQQHLIFKYYCIGAFH